MLTMFMIGSILLLVIWIVLQLYVTKNNIPRSTTVIMELSEWMSNSSDPTIYEETIGSPDPEKEKEYLMFHADYRYYVIKQAKDLNTAMHAVIQDFKAESIAMIHFCKISENKEYSREIIRKLLARLDDLERLPFDWSSVSETKRTIFLENLQIYKAEIQRDISYFTNSNNLLKC